MLTHMDSLTKVFVDLVKGSMFSKEKFYLIPALVQNGKR